MRVILALAGLAALVAAETAAPAKEAAPATHDAGWWKRAKCYACKTKYTTKCRYASGYKGYFSTAKNSTKG